ncbi:MAG TPA: hypothetical protein VGX37_05085 [Allosphingosinicella sp.]|jgi:hypothetical protein|nr:hypothetical protein [Allosphingosinicella sp.]
MVDSNPLDFTPVPLRNRRGGWTAERQRAFIAALGKGLRPARAAAALGLSRQSAYLLREHRDGASFAGAWESAVAAARARKRSVRAPGEWERAVAGILHPIRYRGRIAAWDRRFSNVALRRLLGRAEQLLEKRAAGEADYFADGMAKLCQEPAPGAAAANPRKPPG